VVERLETEISKKRSTRTTGYTDPVSGEFVLASELKMQALIRTSSDEKIRNFQPMNVNFGIFDLLVTKERDKRKKNALYAKRALDDISMTIALQMPPYDGVSGKGNSRESLESVAETTSPSDKD
jgi:hypothetical protein